MIRFGLGPADGRAQHPEAAGDDGHPAAPRSPRLGPWSPARPRARSVATRRPAMGSALSALTFERTPGQVDGRQSCWAHSHRSSSSPTVRNGAARRMDREVLGELQGRTLGGDAPRPPRVLRGTRTSAARSDRRPGRHRRRHGSRRRRGRFSRSVPLGPEAPIRAKQGS